MTPKVRLCASLLSSRRQRVVIDQHSVAARRGGACGLPPHRQHLSYAAHRMHRSAPSAAFLARRGRPRHCSRMAAQREGHAVVRRGARTATGHSAAPIGRRVRVAARRRRRRRAPRAVAHPFPPHLFTSLSSQSQHKPTPAAARCAPSPAAQAPRGRARRRCASKLHRAIAPRRDAAAARCRAARYACTCAAVTDRRAALLALRPTKYSQPMMARRRRWAGPCCWASPPRMAVSPLRAATCSCCPEHRCARLCLSCPHACW